MKPDFDHISGKTDCGFIYDGMHFRMRACGIIIKNGCVLMAKNDRDPYYYSVGGAVHFGEKLEDAVEREVFEETGEHYEADRLCFIHENFFEEKSTKIKSHEIAFYFLMKEKEVTEFSSVSTSSGNIPEHMHWLPIDSFSECFAYPAFFGEKLKNIESTNSVEHIVTAED